MKNLFNILFLCFFTIFLNSCAKPSGSDTTSDNNFNPDDALEVFIQPQEVGSSVTATEPDLVSGTPAELNFGIISASTGKTKGLKITNKTASAKNISFENINPPFSIALNKCTSPVNPNQSCYVYIKIDSSWFTLDGPISPVQINIKYGTTVSDVLPILLKATISNGVNSPTGWVIQGQMTQGFDGTFTLGTNPGTRIVYLYNPGTVAAPLAGINLTITPYYKIATNRCVDYLLPKQKCPITLLYENFTNQSPSNYHGIIRYNKNSSGDREGFDTYLKQIVSAETYISTYSAYPTNPVANACQGTQNVFRTITDCKKQSDNSSIAVSFCSDPFPFKTYKSPAGLGNATTIPNGNRYENCPEGQTTGTFVYQCDPLYQLQGTTCIPLFTTNETSYMTQSVGSKRVIDNGYIIHNYLGNEINRPASNNGYIIWSGEQK